MGLRVGSNIILFFLPLYIAASHTTHVKKKLCVCIVSCHICIRFVNTYIFDNFFNLT